MLKFFVPFLSALSSLSVSADCEISGPLKNKICSSDYFTAKNSHQLNEYLRFGKFKDGKLLNLGIGFNVKNKETNIGTTCDLKLEHGTSIQANLHGICLQGKNIYIEKNSNLLADKKASIELIANDSIKIRKTIIHSLGAINISTKSFNLFSGEILISKNSQLFSEEINITTPSSLIINEDSKIKSPNVILNGGNCEIGDSDDQDDDNNRNRERQCQIFRPKFSYSGKCKTNPIPISLKISSTTDKANSLKSTYSIIGSPINAEIKWKFDDKFESSGNNTVHSFLFPGKHLAEVVISNTNGYFRKLSTYKNVNPTKFNKGQMAIFQFSSLKNGPSKVLAMMGLKKFTLIKSEQNSELYLGEIPSDSVGTKSILIPELNYTGKFNLVVLPTINKPNEYINSFIDSMTTSLEELSNSNLQVNNLASSVAIVLAELKKRIDSLPLKDQAMIASKLQANTEGFSSTVTESNSFYHKFNILNLILPTVHAQPVSYADKFIPPRIKEYTTADMIEAGAGITWITTGILLLKTPGTFYSIDKLTGIGLVALGISTILKYHQKKNKILNDLYDFIGNITSFNVEAGEINTIRLAGTFVPVSTSSKSTLLQKSQALTNEFNDSISPINTSLISINSLLDSIGLSGKIIGNIPTLSFPTNSYQSSLSSDFITDVKLISSEHGDVSLKSVEKIEDGIKIQFNPSRSKNATVRIYYKNDDFNVYVYKDVTVKITNAPPKAIINYTKKDLVVNFDSTDPEDPDLTELTYDWDFGDGQNLSTQSKEITHTYAKAGSYNVSLTVSDSHGTVSTAETSIEISSSLVKIKINPNQTFFRMVSNPYDDIYSPAPAIPIPLESAALGMLEMGAFNTSDSCFPCLQTSMVVVFSDGANYLPPGPSSFNISFSFFQTPSRYYVPPQAFAISSDSNYPSYVEIPAGAKYIYVSPADDYFKDNTDYGYYLYMNSGGF